MATLIRETPRRWRAQVTRVTALRARRARAAAYAVIKPFDRSAALVFFGSSGLVAILIFETVAAALVLDQALVDSFYGAVKTLVTVDPNPEVQTGPKWFKVVISASMLIALLFAALGKIFLYDLAFLTAMARAVSFIVTGSVLLLAALLLQRFAPQVKAALGDEPPEAIA